LILKSGVNHTSRGSISTSTLPSIKLRKCSSKIITSILSFISGRLATKSNQIKQLIRNGRSASLQRTFKKSFTSFSHSTRNKTRDVSNIQTGAERMPHDLSHLGFLAGQIGRLITISTTPVIAGDSFEMDAVGALRLSPLRRGLAIDSTV